MPLSERKDTSPEVIQFIEKSIYKQILIGEVDLKKPVHVTLRQKGQMNPEEKALFDHVNNVLQYPPCVVKARVIVKSQTRRVYGYDIARYVEFMAKNGITVDMFKVDGVFMYMCMREWVNKRLEKEEMEVSNTQATMSKFRSAMGILQQFLAVYELKNCHDEEEYDARYEQLVQIPNLHKFDEYVKERQSMCPEIPKEHFHNKERLIQARYTIENVKAMMRNRLAETANGGKKAIYDGINARLEFLLGHHYLLRSSNKCLLNLSDSMWDAETVGNQTINVLGFHISEGETIKSNVNSSIAGALRHKDVDLCFVSAFAMSLWYRFDFDDGPLSGENFPDFLKKSDWYPIKVLFSTGKTKGRERISHRYNNALSVGTVATIGFTTIKKTHLERTVNPYLVDAAAIEESQINRADWWSRDMVHFQYYPFEYLKFSAGFDKGETYYISRDIEVPENLKHLIFPWLEREIHKVENRPDKHESNFLKQDGTILRFLKMLKAFRSIIIQDLAVMMDHSPKNMFTEHKITKHPYFVTFKDSMEQVIAENYESTQMMLAKSVADTAPVFAEKMESVREVIERQFTNTSKVREELRLFREELGLFHEELRLFREESKFRNEALKEFWRTESLTDLKNTLVHDLQDYLRVTVADAVADAVTSAVTSAVMHKKVISEFEVKKHFSEEITPLKELLYGMKNFNSMPQLLDGASTSTDDSSKKRKTFTDDSNKKRKTVIPFNHRLISRHTESVVDAYHEWYTSKNEYMCFKERDERYGVDWRRENPTIGLHKRRRNLDKFINDQLHVNNKFKQFTKLEFANLLEAYRVREKLKLSTLCERLGSKERLVVVFDLENHLKSQSH